jgi:hypothetical protein
MVDDTEATEVKPINLLIAWQSKRSVIRDCALQGRCLAWNHETDSGVRYLRSQLF